MLLTSIRRRLRLSAGMLFSAQGGMSIIELLLAAGLVGTVVSLSSSFIPRVLNSRNRLESVSARDGIALQIKRIATLSNLKYSAQAFNNTALLNCIDGNPNTLCTATSTTAWQNQSFKLAFPKGGQPFVVSGTATAPLTYQRSGGPCSGSTCMPAAEWAVSTYFSAICPGSPPCGDAISIRFRYWITPVRGSYLLAADQQSVPEGLQTPPLPSIPFGIMKLGDLNTQPNKGSLLIPNSSNFLNGNQACGPNQIIESISTNGTPVCRCQVGSTTISTNPLVCGLPSLDCSGYPKTYRLVGYTQPPANNPTGDFTPICKEVKWNCFAQSTSSSCIGGIVNSFDLGICQVNTSTTKKGTGTTEVTCSTNSQTCCMPYL